jgi:hypothetical protein
MKQLGRGASDAAWNSEIAGQLGFIKKHLRYPIGIKTMWPAILLSTMLPAFGFIIYLTLTTKSTGNHKPVWLMLLFMCIMLIPGINTARRYMQTLRFIAVPARRSLAENLLLLQQFLLANHFAIGRHPELPEVFQIISKSISALQDEREVVIFIADDHRILVNSHFTQSRFKAPIGSPHCRQVAKMLADWIGQNASGETGLQTF